MLLPNERNINDLLLLLIKNLSKLWIAVLIMYVIGTFALFLNLQFDNQKNIETWSELFTSELNEYHRKAEIYNFDSKETDVIVLQLNHNARIIESTDKILIGYNLRKSALFNRIKSLQFDEEYILLFPGLTENRLKVYYTLKRTDGYIVFIFHPDHFFPRIQLDTIFHFVDMSNTVIYSTNERFIGTELKNFPVLFESFDFYSVAPIVFENSDIQKLYIMRNISFPVYALFIVGITFITILLFLRKIVNEMDSNLTLLEKESSRLHHHLFRIPDFFGHKGEGAFQEYKNELLDFQTVLKQEEILFFENKMNRNHYVNFSQLIISLIDNVETKLTEIKEAESKYRLVFENSREGLFQFSTDGIFLAVNDTFAKLLKYDDRDDFMKNRPVEIFRNIREQVIYALKEHKSISREAAIPCKNGELIELLLSAQVIRKNNGTMQYIHGSIRDLAIATEEQRIIFEKERLNTITKAKNNFLASVSHELRTPLNSVIGFAELLAGRNLNNKEKGYVNAIITAGKSLLTLINDVLDLSKAEAGKIEPVYTEICLPVLLKDMEVLFNGRIEQKQLQYSSIIEDDCPYVVFCDEKLVRQICMNLIGNAVKFTKAGYIKVHFSVSAFHDDTIDLEISVSDSGKGIATKDQLRIFEPFSQEGKQNEGTGLGLAISKKLVNILHGSIQLKSKLNEGSCFTVQIPKLKYSNKQTQKIDTINESILFENQTILIADDEPFNRELMEDFLIEYNLKVLSAQNGADALELLEHHAIDLVLMDIRMPVMNGIEASKRIKSIESLAKIPLIAYTASTVESEINQTDLFDAVILKPAKLDKLLLELQKHLSYKSQNESLKEEQPRLLVSNENYRKIDAICMTAGTNSFVLDIEQLSQVITILDSVQDDSQNTIYANKLQTAVDNYDFEEIESLLIEIKNNLQLLEGKNE